MEVNKNEINLDKYIQGELTGNDLKEFEALLEKDEVLKQKADFHQYADTVLHDKLGEANKIDPALKSIIENLGDKYFVEEEITNEKEIIQEEKVAKPSIIKRLLPFATSAAAAALLLFLSLPNQFDRHFDLLKVKNSQSSTTISNDFEKANERYKSKNYKDAIFLYDKSLTENSNNPYALQYKGCAEMELDQIDKAINTFQQLATQHIDFKDLANWYLALSYLKKGEEQKAKNTLKFISKDDKEYYEKAQQLLKEL